MREQQGQGCTIHEAGHIQKCKQDSQLLSEQMPFKRWPHEQLTNMRCTSRHMITSAGSWGAPSEWLAGFRWLDGAGKNRITTQAEEAVHLSFKKAEAPAAMMYVKWRANVHHPPLRPPPRQSFGKGIQIRVEQGHAAGQQGIRPGENQCVRWSMAKALHQLQLWAGGRPTSMAACSEIESQINETAQYVPTSEGDFDLSI
eukprot:1161078-Pelagomonas_calceolata.AAC.19